jgi:hypothetical protein
LSRARSRAARDRDYRDEHEHAQALKHSH